MCDHVRNRRNFKGRLMPVQQDHESTGGNLSEVLFKPKFKYTETSLISNSGAELPRLEKKDVSLGFTRGWYRPISRFLWTWQGGNLMDIDAALSAIASSKNARSRPQCLDTVSEYGGGNWIFEFSSIAQKRAVKGRELEERGDLTGASHQYRMASRYFALAAYPRLRGDTLAADAAMLGARCYRSMCRCEPQYGRALDLPFNTSGCECKALLHLPDTDRIHPCVVIMASYELSLVDFYRFYVRKLFPKGIALAVVEMPGIGMSEKIKLTADQSSVLECALDALKALPYIDSEKIGLFGIKLGGSACIREALMRPREIKALALAGPAVHSFFTDPEILNSLPLCKRSLYANRLNLDASKWEIVIPLLKQLSLKEQGLLGRGRSVDVPCFNFILSDALPTREDRALLRAAFSDYTEITQSEDEYSKNLSTAVESAADFFSEKLL